MKQEMPEDGLSAETCHEIIALAAERRMAPGDLFWFVKQIIARETKHLPAQPQAPAWQSVETAPKDIEVLMCWEVEWPEKRWEYASGLWGSTRGGWNHGQATHWMPLPGAPR